jgi:hypothetical protein
LGKDFLYFQRDTWVSVFIHSKPNRLFYSPDWRDSSNHSKGGNGMKKWLFVLMGAVIGLAAMGAGAWLGVLLISGNSPELKSVIGPTLIGPILGAWFGARFWTDRHTIAERAVESLKEIQDL